MVELILTTEVEERFSDEEVEDSHEDDDHNEPNESRETPAKNNEETSFSSKLLLPKPVPSLGEKLF
jgi:hypothetical protein